MTSIGEMLSAAQRTDGGFTATITPNWLQGRTAYGGLSSALALHAIDELPRSAIGKVLKRELRDQLTGAAA